MKLTEERMSLVAQYTRVNTKVIVIDKTDKLGQAIGTTIKIILTKMKTLLLDDEQYCTDVLNLLIQKHCPSLQVVAIFNDPLLAIEYLKIYPVDLLF